ncbi:MAG: hypothetical protein NTW28_04895 [Candidatus Solibacter sp.]|nr:hypothetical protein [Candidatus Solibacter sp.]
MEILNERKGAERWMNRQAGGLFLYVLCAATVLVTPARADVMGTTLSWQPYFDDGPWTVLVDDNQGTFVVPGPVWSWESSPLSVGSTILSGLAIGMASGSAFTSVTLHSAPGVSDFDSLGLTGTQDNVDDFGDIPGEVPEPEGLVLLATVLAIIALSYGGSHRLKIARQRI